MDKELAKRIQNRIRVRKCREKRKLLDGYSDKTQTMININSTSEDQHGLTEEEDSTAASHYCEAEDDALEFNGRSEKSQNENTVIFEENVNDQLLHEHDPATEFDNALECHANDAKIPEHPHEPNEPDEPDRPDEADGSGDQMQEIHLLRSWAVRNNIKHKSLDELLNILRQRLLPDLPASTKTFLDTSSAQYIIQEMASAQGDRPGEFVYFGIKEGLEKCIDPAVHKSEDISLQVNVDGMPIFNSGNVNFWPILVKVHFTPDIYQAYPVAIYCGNYKPKNLKEYLQEFIEEVNKLQAEGVMISGTKFNIKIKCFVCDTPARSFLKCTKGHGGYSACERCTIVGSRFNKRMIYPLNDCQERTDADFRNMSSPDHHTANSPLTEINPKINMIMSFVLDFMHLCCLGVMKKLIILWMAGPLTVRLGQTMKREINRRIDSLKVQVPVEFQRKPRSLIFYLQFKATEFRFFLLYSGPVVLKNVLNKTMYNHFLLFHAACRILCSKTLAVKYNRTAKVYLNRFFIAAQTIYGLDTAVLNMHNITHLADDVKEMNCDLSQISAFPFESTLGRLKKYIRTPHKPLSQICRRLHEESFLSIRKPQIPEDIQILKIDSKSGKILKIRYKGFTITSKSPDNVVLANNKTVFVVTGIQKVGNVMHIQGRTWEKKKPLFEYPFSSQIIGMWQLSDKSSDQLLNFPLNSVDCKMVKLSVSLKETGKVKNYVIPFLHH